MSWGLSRVKKKPDGFLVYIDDALATPLAVSELKARRLFDSLTEENPTSRITIFAAHTLTNDRQRLAH